MNFNMLFAFALGTALTLTPASLTAQLSAPMPSQQNANGNQPQQNTTGDTTGMGTAAASDSSGSMGANGQLMRDKIFVRKASQGGMAEVSFAQLALQKSDNPEVKKLAQKMIADHTILNGKMKPVADSLGVPPPTQLNAMHQAESDKLSSLSGTDFDKAYLDYMVKDHHKDLAEFRREAAIAADPQLKAVAADGAKAIAQHTRMVDELASKNGVVIPSTGQ